MRKRKDAGYARESARRISCRMHRNGRGLEVRSAECRRAAGALLYFCVLVSSWFLQIGYHALMRIVLAAAVLILGLALFCQAQTSTAPTSFDPYVGIYSLNSTDFLSIAQFAFC